MIFFRMVLLFGVNVTPRGAEKHALSPETLNGQRWQVNRENFVLEEHGRVDCSALDTRSRNP
jgi:hypothetical protein